MTIKELSQLYHLKKEITELGERLYKLKTEAYAASSANLSGMPAPTGNTSKTERYAIEIAALEDMISDRQDRCIDELFKLEQWINMIDDSRLRLIFTYRFVNRLSWVQVAFRIGGYETEDSVKKACYRYLKEDENDNTEHCD